MSDEEKDVDYNCRWRIGIARGKYWVLRRASQYRKIMIEFG